MKDPAGWRWRCSLSNAPMLWLKAFVPGSWNVWDFHRRFASHAIRGSSMGASQAGPNGPFERSGGHDINYIALSGALHAMGRANANPAPPLNLVGDFGGGGMLVAFGILCGIIEAKRSGVGQVVDAAMVEGAALQMAMIYGLKAAGRWTNQREANLLDVDLIFTTPINAPTGSGSPWARSNRSFTRSCARSWRSNHRQTRQSCRNCFSHRRAPNGARSLKAQTLASRRYSISTKAPEHRHTAARGSFVTVDGVTQLRRATLQPYSRGET